MGNDEQGVPGALQDEWNRAVQQRRAALRRRAFAAGVGVLVAMAVSVIVVPAVLLGILYAIWKPNAGPGETFLAHWSWSMDGGVPRGAGRGLALLCTPGVLTGLWVYRKLRPQLSG